MSGRALRRLPVLACARYVAADCGEDERAPVEVWLRAMERVVAENKQQSEKMIWD